MKVDVLTSIDIMRPREQVATFTANPDNAPLWYVNIKSAAWIDDPPLRVGSHIAFEANFLGRALSYVYDAT